MEERPFTIKSSTRAYGNWQDGLLPSHTGPVFPDSEKFSFTGRSGKLDYQLVILEENVRIYLAEGLLPYKSGLKVETSTETISLNILLNGEVSCREGWMRPYRALATGFNLFFRPPGRLYLSSNGNPSRPLLLCIVLRHDFFSGFGTHYHKQLEVLGIGREIRKSRKLFTKPAIMDAPMYQLVWYLIHLLENKEADGFRAKLGVLNIIAAALSCFGNDKNPIDEKGKFLQGIAIAEQWLLSNPDQRFPGIRKLSRMCGTNTTSFKYYFKYFTGKTAHSYWMDNRLELCRKMLSERKLTPSEIAVHMSFHDVQAFSHAFHRKYGVYPSHYTKD